MLMMLQAGCSTPPLLFFNLATYFWYLRLVTVDNRSGLIATVMITFEDAPNDLTGNIFYVTGAQHDFLHDGWRQSMGYPVCCHSGPRPPPPFLFIFEKSK